MRLFPGMSLARKVVMLSRYWWVIRAMRDLITSLHGGGDVVVSGSALRNVTTRPNIAGEYLIKTLFVHDGKNHKIIIFSRSYFLMKNIEFNEIQLLITMSQCCNISFLISHFIKIWEIKIHNKNFVWILIVSLTFRFKKRMSNKHNKIISNWVKSGLVWLPFKWPF